MAKSPAQRQKTFRNKHGKYRINMCISSEAYFAIENLARFHGKTKKAMLEQIVGEVNGKFRETLEPDTPEWHKYYGW